MSEAIRKIEMTVDELDYKTIQAEFSLRQGQRRPLPDGESCIRGAMVAEIIRDLIEYRDIHGVSDG